MNISLAITLNKGVSTTMSNFDYEVLSATTLKGCPFKDYFAIDLLRDLIQMYSWRMERGRNYSISEFLTLCNDAHAEAYRTIYEA